jgi:hypothetical protein
MSGQREPVGSETTHTQKPRRLGRFRECAAAECDLVACLPVREIMQFARSFCSHYRTFLSGVHHQRTAQGVP